MATYPEDDMTTTGTLLSQQHPETNPHGKMQLEDRTVRSG